MGGKGIPTVLEQIKAKGDDLKVEDIVFTGFGGVLCIEAGGPTPGVGCAGRGIITAFEKLEELQFFEKYQPDVVLYDVLGDVVCGGFAMPIRGGYAQDVYVVSSGEMILNDEISLMSPDEIVRKACEEIGTSIVATIPRCGDIQIAENQGCTVLEALPESEMCEIYRALARDMMKVGK